MISHRYKCIYVKMPKCASSSLLWWFQEHGQGWNSFRPYWYGGLLALRIQGLARIINLYPDYATFAFVRNPYARFVSVYLHLRRIAEVRPGGLRGHPDDYGTLREFAELCHELLDDFRPRWGREARAFYEANAEREYGPRRLRLKQLGFVTGHALPQTDFLPDCHPRRLYGVRRVNDDPLSFIGRVEEIEEDFARLADMLALPDIPLPRRNSSGHDGRDPYADYYDDATRRLVEEIYAADFEFTGYGFQDGRTTVAVPAPGFPRMAAHPARDRNPATLPRRLWRRLCALEIRAETRIIRSARMRRLLRSLKKLRGLPT